MKQTIGYNSIIRNNSATITYAYDQINDLGVITKGNVQESFILLPTDIDLIAANNVLLNAINLRLNPIVTPILGNIQIKYVDSNGIDLEVPTTLTSLPLGTYFYTAKDFVGFNLIGNLTSSIILTDDTPGVITFTYSKILKGNITIKYQCGEVDLEIPTVNVDLVVGSYTFNNKVFEGYTLNNESSQTTVLSSENLNPIITFNYTKTIVAQTGSVTLSYQSENSINIEAPTVISDLALGSYDYSGKVFEGYTLTDISTQTAVLNTENLNISLVFNYTTNIA